MEIVNYLRVLRRRWQLVIVCGLVGLALGISTGLLVPEETTTNLYRATHTLLSSDNGTTAGNATLQQMRVLVTEGDVPRRVAAKIGGNPQLLASQVFVVAQPEVGMLKISAVASEPQRSVQMADTFAGELVAYQIELSDRQKESQLGVLEQEKERQKEIYADALIQGQKDPAAIEYWKRVKDAAIRKSEETDAEIEKLRTTPPKSALATLSTAEPVPISGKAFAAFVQSINTPSSGTKTPTSTPSVTDLDVELGGSTGPGPTTRAGLGFAFGLFLGAALALVIERLDPRIRTKEDAEDVYGLPVIAETPPLSRRQ